MKEQGGLDKRYYGPEWADKPLARHPSSQKFHDLCDAMKAMHDKKQQDYGRANDPFANVRSTEEWGQPAWVGAMIRATDKMRRLQKVAAGGTLANEGVEDSFMDLAVYAIIGLVLYRESIPVITPFGLPGLDKMPVPSQELIDRLNEEAKSPNGKWVEKDGKFLWVPENAR